MATQDFIKATLKQRMSSSPDVIMATLGLVSHGDERIFKSGATPSKLETLIFATMLLGDSLEKHTALRGADHPGSDFDEQMRTALADLYARLRELLPPDAAEQHWRAIDDIFAPGGCA